MPLVLPQTPPIEDPPTLTERIFLSHLRQWIEAKGIESPWAELLEWLALLLLVTAAVGITHLVCRRWLLTRFTHAAEKRKGGWQRLLSDHKVFYWLLHLPSLMIALELLPLVVSTEWLRANVWCTKTIAVLMTFVVMKSMVGCAEAAFEYYHLTATRKSGIPIVPDATRGRLPYRSARDMLLILLRTLSVLAAIGIVLNLNLSGLVTLVSAFAAVIVLVFKDSILGFVAGMLLTRDKMIRIGDRLTLDNPTAQGIVEEVTLMTLKLKDRDETTFYVPTYTLLTRTFHNWREMKESGRWRVTATWAIDTESIRETTAPLEQWIERVKNILKGKEWVSKTPYTLIQIVPSTGEGLPVTCYYFLQVETWVEYVQRQTEVQQEVLQALSECGLKLFQHAITSAPPASSHRP